MKIIEWWKLGDDAKRVWKFEWWVMSDGLWVMSDEWWKLSDENWVIKKVISDQKSEAKQPIRFEQLLSGQNSKDINLNLSSSFMA